MKKVIPLTFLAIGFLLKGSSQDISQSVIAAGGGMATNENIRLEWTLGEVAVEPITTPQNLYTQGFHQPFLFVKKMMVVKNQDLFGYDIKIMPNPVQSNLTIKLAAESNERFRLRLISITGQLLPAHFVYGNSTITLNMGGMISGIYILEVRDASGQFLQTFKIIKAD